MGSNSWKDGVIRHLWNGNTCSKCKCIRIATYWQRKRKWKYILLGEDKGLIRPNCCEKPIATLRTSEYIAIHVWLKYNYGKASKCENIHCFRKIPSVFQWALKKGFEHKRDRTHYAQLCASCHRRYDINEETKKKMSLRHRGSKHTESHKNKMSKSLKGNGAKLVIKKSITGEYISEHNSVTDAAEKNGVKIRGISAALCGKLKTYAGFVWEYKQVTKLKKDKKLPIKIQ